MYYFYVLQSSKNADYFYKGSTVNLRRRFAQHNAGDVFSSRPYAPYTLVYYEAYATEKAARDREHSVKKSGAVWGALMGRVKQGLVMT
ncbi:GIY-YIG nuclease family protein [Candidatus Peregrinibacteria bacterium]|nr:GIY-YIG nuclease family protein [Candidatus Peregrinibacteria bacterium]